MKAKRAYLKEERIMEKIHINLGSDSYDVHIESGLIDKAGSAIADLTGAEKQPSSQKTPSTSCTACVSSAHWKKQASRRK